MIAAALLIAGAPVTVESFARRRMGPKRPREESSRDDYLLTPDGLRHVKPYLYDFRTNAKGRWYGRKLLEVRWPFGSRAPLAKGVAKAY